MRCSYANFRTSYRRLDGVNYTIYPGEWVCRLSELGKEENLIRLSPDAGTEYLRF